jgi:hypothetical protein
MMHSGVANPLAACFNTRGWILSQPEALFGFRAASFNLTFSGVSLLRIDSTEHSFSGAGGAASPIDQSFRLKPKTEVATSVGATEVRLSLKSQSFFFRETATYS